MNERVPWQGWRKKGEDAGLPAARGPGSRRPFGATWWGRAWLEALEQRARLDPNRLSRGRSYARRGSVLELTVTPGSVEAVVQGSRVNPYQVTVKIRAFSSAQWDAVLDVVSAQIGRVAALLDGELPPEVVDDVHAAGLDVLPTAGEVRTNCSCPDFAVPCKHSAAVCYLIADALDDDPFALLLLRGRRKDELLSALRSRRSAAESKTSTRPSPPPGIPAKTAFARTSSAVVPVPPRPLGTPGVPAAVRVLDPPRSSGVDVRDLVALATDATRRAWELASGDGDGGLGLTFDQDLVRRAALVLGTPDLADLAHRAGVSARHLTSWAVAWREGGPGGLAVAVGRVDVDEVALAEGVEALGGSVDGNRVTAGRTQLRLGPDGLWYRFDQHFNDWTLTGPPSPDPRDLLNGQRRRLGSGG
ncbi:putative Zn finger protein [Kribbella antiqua]|uniref:Putative Zn finger protein n=1 Tax=Kribbella antiqua TaxID=2512217 RepID=A0A4R2I218_9ACTN|nr:SWIM zinc finger family protein [Kribbella antiqua]TCO38101.1 putative Zn finger protein [Kribbella antiqua]